MVPSCSSFSISHDTRYLSVKFFIKYMEALLIISSLLKPLLLPTNLYCDLETVAAERVEVASLMYVLCKVKWKIFSTMLFPLGGECRSIFWA